MIYISGKITDDTPEKVKANLQKFYDKEKELGQSDEILNPAKHEEDGKTWEQYLIRDLLWIYEKKPILYMMRGWEDSRGAKLERELAIQMGLIIIYE